MRSRWPPPAGPSRTSCASRPRSVTTASSAPVSERRKAERTVLLSRPGCQIGARSNRRGRICLSIFGMSFSTQEAAAGHTHMWTLVSCACFFSYQYLISLYTVLMPAVLCAQYFACLCSIAACLTGEGLDPAGRGGRQFQDSHIDSWSASVCRLHMIRHCRHRSAVQGERGRKAHSLSKVSHETLCI